jgi:pimeloyl-ACP methyl ester carboxylesterase
MAEGHDAVAIDLPGHGEDRTPAAAVTLQDYVDRTIEAIQAAGDAIVVGHSMGGGIMAQAAEFIPDRIRALAYVAGLVPPSGSTMMQAVAEFDPEYLAHFLWAPDGRSAGIAPEGVRRFLYSHCPPHAIESALPLFTPQPVAPYEAPLQVTEANFGRVPRYYIECLQDRVVPIASQRAMHSAIRFTGICSIDTGHSPFFSAPEELSRILSGIAEQAA